MDDRLSSRASDALIFTTYGVFLAVGIVAGIAFRRKGEYFSAHTNRNGVFLALNFLATGLGSTVLTSYPQAAAYAGLQGILVYALSTALPLFAFAWLGPRIRRERPNGFVFTEWVFWRYGPTCGAVFSACTVVTIYLFAASELSNMREGLERITGKDERAAIYVEAAFVALYLAQGGFGTSFFTDNIQSATMLVLVVISTAAMASHFDLDGSLVGKSDLLKSNKLGWKMLYFLMVESVTNDFLLAGFWMRTFAARNTVQLFIGCTLAAALLFIICSITGVAGLMAIWSGIVNLNDPNLYRMSQLAFFDVLLPMPVWVHGVVIVLLISMSICTFDSLVSSLVTTIHNDLFRNRIRLVHVRILTFVLMLPIVALAMASPNILSICDLLAVAIIPTLFLGLNKRMYFVSGLEPVLGLVGGVLSVFIYGTVYYGSARGGGDLIVLNNGIYTDDWGPFGIFAVAPIGSLLGGLVGFTLRFLYFWRTRGRASAVFDRGMPNWDHRASEFFKSEWYRLHKPRWWGKVHWFLFTPPEYVENLHDKNIAKKQWWGRKIAEFWSKYVGTGDTREVEDGEPEEPEQDQAGATGAAETSEVATSEATSKTSRTSV